MKASTKSSIILISTLIIGIIIGALGSGMLQQKRIETIKRMDPRQRFKEALFEIIKPDKKQRKAIEDILKAQTDKIARLDEEYQNEVFAVFDSTREKIRYLLSEEQLRKFEEGISKGQKQMMARRLKHMKEFLRLSDEQYQKIEKIIQQSKIAKGPFFLGDKTDYLNHQRSRDSLIKKIERILTPQQVEKYKEMQMRRKNIHPLK